MPKIIFLRGIPGSGKSTIAKKMISDTGDGIIISADDFFVSPSGDYDWSNSGLAKAHAWCQERLVYALQRNVSSLIIIDNCNLTIGDISAYLRVCEAFRSFSQFLIFDVAVGEQKTFDEIFDQSLHLKSLNSERTKFHRIFKEKKYYNFSIRDCWAATRQIKLNDTFDVKRFRRRVQRFLEDQSGNLDPIDVLLLPSYALEQKLQNSTSENNGPTGKLVVEVTLNDGNKRSPLPFLFALSNSFDELRRLACAKLKKATNGKRARLFALDGFELKTVSDLPRAVLQGQSNQGHPIIAVSPSGKPFLPVDLKGKKTCYHKPTVGGSTPPISSASFGRLPLGMKLIFQDDQCKLYVGSARDACDLSQLRRNQITDVICVASDCPSLRKTDGVLSHDFRGCLDQPSPFHEWLQLLLEFSTVVDDNLLKSDGKAVSVLVHCIAGKNRSPAFLVGYLMRSKGLRLREALNLFSSNDKDLASSNFVRHFLPHLLDMDHGSDDQLGGELLALNPVPDGVWRWLNENARRPCEGEKPTHAYISTSTRLTDLFIVPISLRKELLGVLAATTVAGGPTGHLQEFWSEERFLMDLKDKSLINEVVRQLALIAEFDDLFVIMFDSFCRIVCPSLEWKDFESFASQFPVVLDHPCQCTSVDLGNLYFVDPGSYNLVPKKNPPIIPTTKSQLCGKPVLNWSHDDHSKAAQLFKFLEKTSICLPPRQRHFTDLYCNGLYCNQEIDGQQLKPLKEPKHEMDIVVELKKWGLEKLSKREGLQIRRHQKHRNLVSLHYSSSAGCRSKVAAQARGTIVDLKRNFKLVALPFVKFWNEWEQSSINELKQTATIEIEKEEKIVSEKIDGSLALLYFYEGEWHVGSQRTPDGSGLVDGSTSFCDLFWNAWTTMQYPRLPEGSVECCPDIFRLTDCVFMFELFHPRLPIIVKPRQPLLILTGARHMNSLMELDPRLVAPLLKVNCVRHFPELSHCSLAEIRDFVNRRNWRLHEGVVVRNSSFNRVKVKNQKFLEANQEA